MKNTIKPGSNRASDDNYEVYSPDNKLMFITGKNRVDWYLSKKLAEIIDSKSIKLNFKPKGYGYHKSKDIFGLSKQVVQCVISGEKNINKLQKHHVVPYMYRRHLPLEYKSKNHHDLVFIRHDLHQFYEKYSDNFKSLLSLKYQVNDYKEITNINNKAYIKEIFLCKLINTILTNYEKIPYDKFVANIKKISEISGIDRKLLDEGLLYNLFKKNKNIIKNDILERRIDHGKLVIDNVDDYEEFIKIWREHFVLTMKPKYLPKGWSINRISKLTHYD